MKGQEENSRLIPSLDGLRALSVVAVILGHTESALLDRIPFSASFRNGGQGVAVFFVISGFLITHLLIKELRREGQISLHRFYLRRTFRIFPPFYFYLLVVAFLSLLQKVPVKATSMLAAATYTWNYVPSAEGWILGHSWSLAIEEQFYLLWPACMAYFSRRTNLSIAAGVILLSPPQSSSHLFCVAANAGPYPHNAAHASGHDYDGMFPVADNRPEHLAEVQEICASSRGLHCGHRLLTRSGYTSSVLLEGKVHCDRGRFARELGHCSAAVVCCISSRITAGQNAESEAPATFRNNLVWSVSMAAALYRAVHAILPSEYPLDRRLR